MSSDSDPGPRIDAAARILMIIQGALIAGVLGFGVVSVVMNVQRGGLLRGDLAGVEMPFDVLAPVIAIITSSAAMFVPPLTADAALRRIAAGEPVRDPQGEVLDRTGMLLAAVTTERIMRAALIEGGAFFAIISYFLTGRPIPAVVALIMIVQLAARFPTRNAIEVRLNEFRERLRMLGAG